jgi:hypothetical protein
MALSVAVLCRSRALIPVRWRRVRSAASLHDDRSAWPLAASRREPQADVTLDAVATVGLGPLLSQQLIAALGEDAEAGPSLAVSRRRTPAASPARSAASPRCRTWWWPRRPRSRQQRGGSSHRAEPSTAHEPVSTVGVATCRTLGCERPWRGSWPAACREARSTLASDLIIAPHTASGGS